MEDCERSMELDFGIVDKVISQTREVKSNLFLWGGEPLYYNEWDKVANLIEKDPRWTVLCTNGILIEEKMDSLLKISSNLAILASIEGFETENDVLPELYQQYNIISQKYKAIYNTILKAKYSSNKRDFVKVQELFQKIFQLERELYKTYLLTMHGNKNILHFA